MNLDALPARPAPDRLHPAARRRLGLRLTPAERKAILFVIDLLLVNGALLTATALWAGFKPSLGNLWANVKWFFTLSVVWEVVAAILDLYRPARAADTISILASAGLAALLAGGLNLAIPWLTPPIVTRTYAAGYMALTVVPLIGWRVLYATALAQPALYRRALLLGETAAAGELVRELSWAGRVQEDGSTPRVDPVRSHGYQFVGVVGDCPQQAEAPGEREGSLGLPWLGHIGDLASLARRHGADEIVVALANGERAVPAVHEALLDCRELGLQVITLSEAYERLLARLPVGHSRHDVDLLLGPADSAGVRLYAVAKRGIDLAIALVGLVSLGCVLPWVALANALWSPGPLFYRQQRVGKGGRSFAVWKLRSMVDDAEEKSGAVWCADNDPRITPVGHWLRKTRLDELPQFINVLHGEMSAVGPRPERPVIVGALARELPLYRARHAVKPGVTGWAQIRYGYGNSVEDARRKLEYDLYYVQHASLELDLLILLQTVPVVLRMRGQ
jgi:exopolysaccharide biosynthesis polyprenyl glycosylphosphotransferase